MPRLDCPTSAELTAFHLGDLPETVLDDIAEHLEQCPRCEAAARALDGLTDPQWAAFRHSAQAQASAVEEPLPQRIGDYEILERLGRGGMGVVFKARHVTLHRIVALKMLLGGEFADRDERLRFRAEAEAVAGLQHPHIVQLFDIGEHDAGTGLPRPYFTLEFVDSGSLAARLAGRPQPPRQATAWLEPLAQAIHYAHEHGIVHRDLKPSNVLLTRDGQPKICDFGVAKRLEGSDVKTLSGMLVGTAEYMAPEQAEGKTAIGPAADVYALGALLYTMLTGRPPFQGASTLDTLDQVRRHEPVAPRRLQPTVPRDLETICLKCLVKEPRQRYASALHLAEDVQRFLHGQPVLARPISRLERAWKWARRRPGTAALLTLILLLAGIGFPAVTVLWFDADRERQAKEEQSQRAEEKSQLALAAQAEAEAALYFSRIALAEREYFANNVAGAQALLALCSPQEGRPDRRGWEWYYLQRLCHAYRFNFAGHTGYVPGVAFSPDGKLVAAAAGVPGLPGGPGWGFGPPATTPGEFTVWDRPTGEQIKKLVHPGAIQSIDFSPDGRWLVSGCADEFVRLWDTTTFRQEAKFAGVQARFAADGKTLVLVAAGSIKLWDLGQKRERFTIPTPPARERTAFSPNRQWIAFQRPVFGEIQIYDTHSGKLHGTIPGSHASLLGSVSPDGKRVANVGRALEIWDAATGKRILQMHGHVGTVTVAAFSVDGSRLASSGEDHSVRVWDADSGVELFTFRGHAAPGASLAFDQEGKQLVSGGMDGTAKVWDLTQDVQAVQLPLHVHGEQVGSFAFAGDCKAVHAATHINGQMIRLDVASRVLQSSRAIDIFKGYRAPRNDSAFTPDGRRCAAVSDQDARVVKIWDTASGALVARLSGHRGKVNALAFSADGLLLASAAVLFSDKEGAVSGELKVWDVKTNQEIHRLPLDSSVADSMTFDVKGSRLAVASRGLALKDGKLEPSPQSQLRIWDTKDGRPLLRLEGHEGMVCGVAFSPDGRRLASAGFDDPTVRVCDATTGRPIFSPLRAFPSPLTSVAFSPDGKRLAATGYGGMVKLWDAVSGYDVLTLRGPGPPDSGQYAFTARVLFSQDGRFIAANTGTGNINIWEGESGPLLRKSSR